jgi:anaerobic magnesium-protoporphyrin IX monomethyl ester cyclase
MVRIREARGERQPTILDMRSGSSGSHEVVLVAHEPEGIEHLGIRYVAGALHGAGFAPRILPLASFDAIEAACAETAAEHPALVGLSITDALVAPLMLTFARVLRQAGFTGHITAGGPLSTLLRRELLAEQPALDSIIRHDGELAAVALVRAIVEGADLADVPGLTTRHSDGKPNPRAPLHASNRPLRGGRRARIVGLACADVAASRGCTGTCAYCGVAALERDARSEGARWGIAAHPTFGARRRSASDVAAEVAALGREHDVRIVRLVDDNLLGSDPASALQWLRDLQRGLNARGSAPMAWRLMAEPRVISDDVAAALAELGVVQVLVGLESLTETGLRALGRPGAVDRGLRALDRLVQAGIAPIVNVLALRPGGTLAEAQAEIAGLATLDALGVTWDVQPVVVNPGTDLARELEQRGELSGRGLGIAWCPTEPDMQRALYAVERLRVGGLAWLSRLDRGRSVPDVGFALRAGLRCGVPGFSSSYVERVGELLRRAQAERRRVLGLALSLAETGADLAPPSFAQAVEALVAELNARLRPVDADLAALVDEAGCEIGTSTQLRAELLRPSSSLLTTALLVVMSASCSRNTLKAPSRADASFGAPDTSVLVDVAKPTGADASSDAQAQVAPDGPTLPDARLDLAGDTNISPGDAVVAIPDTYPGQEVQCDTNALWKAVTAASGGDECYADPSMPEGSPQLVVDADGKVVDNTGISSTKVKQAWLESVAQSRWPCLAGQTVRYQCLVHLII